MDSTSTPGSAVSERPRPSAVGLDHRHLPGQSTEALLALEDLHRRLELLLEQGPQRLVVDMSDVAHLSSSTFAALLWVRQRCAARGVDLFLRATSRRIAVDLRRIGLLALDPVPAQPSRSATRSALDGRS